MQDSSDGDIFFPAHNHLLRIYETCSFDTVTDLQLVRTPTKSIMMTCHGATNEGFKFFSIIRFLVRIREVNVYTIAFNADQDFTEQRLRYFARVRSSCHQSMQGRGGGHLQGEEIYKNNSMAFHWFWHSSNYFQSKFTRVLETSKVTIDEIACFFLRNLYRGKDMLDPERTKMNWPSTTKT